MKIYIATPINSRPEHQMIDKMFGAKDRVKEIVAAMRKSKMKLLAEAQFYSTFDINRIAHNVNESKAMGNCVRLVMDCDAILLDDEMDSKHPSKGMHIEETVAETYGKEILHYHGSTPIDIPTT